MPTMQYGSAQARIDKFKGEILKHAVPLEVLSRSGRQIKMPANNSKTYVARRWLPFGATATNQNTQNQFFANATGDRGNLMVQAHQIAEGVTPPPDSIVPVDTTVVMQQYGALYSYTDQAADLYEDDIPEAMAQQLGERITLVNEMINWGALRACTNAYYGGAGTSLSTVNGGLTLGLVRKIAKGLQANHGAMVNKVLSAGRNFATDPIAPGYTVFCHTDLEPDIRDLPNFIAAQSYASGNPMENELGAVERFRFITSPDLPSIQDGGAVIGATGLSSTTGTSIDVYPIIVTAQDAWSQLAVRGIGSITPKLISPSEVSKSDPLGQRGYAGAIWYKAVLLENQGWMAVGFVGSKVLV
jgi:N4-gp56 family major capsid protein